MSQSTAKTLAASLIPILLAVAGIAKAGFDEYHAEQEARRAAESRAEVSRQDAGDLGQVVEILSRELAEALAECRE